MPNYSSPSASRSAASLVRPAARLLITNALRPRIGTSTPAISPHPLIAPGCIEVDAADRRQDVDTIWWHTTLRDHVGLAEVRRAELLLGWCTKPFECLHEPRCVLGIRTNPDIETARRPRDAVHAQRMRTDDQELCVRGHQLAKKIAELVDHRCSDRPGSRSVVSRTGM